MASNDNGKLQVIIYFLLYLIIIWSWSHNPFRKFYVGRIQTELEAAKMYDKLAIFYHGIQAKTNFQYTKEAILSLLSEPLPCVEMH